MFPDLSGPYFAEVVLGYEEVAAELGRSVLILSTHGRQAASEMVLDLAARVDGLVVLGRTVDEGVLEAARAQEPPARAARARPTSRGVDSVTAENESSARALVGHLVADHGYRDLAFLGDASTSPDTSQRWDGFRHGLRDHGVGDHPSRALRVRRGRRPAGRPRGAQQGDRPRASGLRQRRDRARCDHGCRGAGPATCPSDVAITGWDDVMAARHARPGLTTVRQPMRQLGARAARRLHERLAGDTSDPRHEVLPTQLVLRASCGHHPKEDQ